MIDKFFDCFVTNYDAGKKKRKPFQDPYCSPDDFVKGKYCTFISRDILIWTPCMPLVHKFQGIKSLWSSNVKSLKIIIFSICTLTELYYNYK